MQSADSDQCISTDQTADQGLHYLVFAYAMSPFGQISLWIMERPFV